jgi:hypothetical protein
MGLALSIVDAVAPMLSEFQPPKPEVHEVVVAYVLRDHNTRPGFLQVSNKILYFAL